MRATHPTGALLATVGLLLAGGGTAAASTEPSPDPITPSIGCGIKWKPGNDPTS